MTAVAAGNPAVTRAAAWLRAGRGGMFLLALVVGAGAGLGAVAFRYLIYFFTWLATGHSEFGQGGYVGSSHLPWLGLGFFVVIPVIGGLVYGPLIYRWAREARGHGVPEVMIAVADNGGRIRWQVSVVKALASALCIGSGGSVGREGPIVQIGSALASSVGQGVRMPENRLRTTVACVALGLLLLALPQMYGVGYPVMYKTAAGGYALWFLVILAFGKILATSLSIGIGGSGGVFAPSLFIGVTSGYAYGDIVHHLFGASAGPPALYAVVAMGAVFTSAARAPLTSLASVVEMTGDFSLTLPVMLAVPPNGKPLSGANGKDGAAGDLDETVLPGRVTYRHDVQTLFASESLGQALRQLTVYGRDGLPVVSADARTLEGWVTNNGVLRAIAQRVAGTAAETADAQAAADWEHEDAQAVREHPSVPLHGYYVAEIVVTPDSPAAGQKLRDISWPTASIPVSVLHRGSLRRPHRDLTLAVGDRLSLLIPAPQHAQQSRQDGSREHVASREAGNGSSSP